MIEALWSFIDSVVCIMFLSGFLNAGKSKRIFILPAAAIYFAVTLITDKYLAGFSVLATLILLFLSLFYAFLVCEKHYVKAVIGCCIYKIGIILTSSTLFVVISNMISDLEALMQDSDSAVRIVYVLIHKVIIFSVFYLIASLFRSKDFNDVVSAVTVFFISALTVVGLGLSLRVIAKTDLAAGTVLVSIFVLVNIGMYLLIDRIRKLEKQKYDLKALNDKYKSQRRRYIEDSKLWESKRKIRHDIKNHLSTIGSLIDSGKFDSCKDYVEKLLDDAGKSGNIFSSENVVLDHLINTKLGTLENVDVAVSGSVGDLSDISENDLVSVMGNILDNAVEAVENIKDPKIELLFSRHGENRIIVCRNTTDHPVLDENKQLKTTKSDTSSHGIGHLIVEDTVKKLKGMVGYHETDGCFSVQVILPYTPPRTNAAEND